MSTTDATRTPVLFIGHGSPMNAIVDNAWSRGFRTVGQALPQVPRAILSVSAHWYVDATLLTSAAQPQTIRDFGGFPRALFEMQYPARGDAALARSIATLLRDWHGGTSDAWGLDHGTWTVLHHLRPEADVPVLQLSIDRRLSPAQHLAVGRALAPLRAQGIVVMGSGNVTHNLRHAFASMQRGDTTTPAWAAQVDHDIAAAIDQRDHAALARLVETDAGRMAHPSIEHYLPLLYAAGAADERDAVSYPIQGWDAASLSMRSVRFG